MEQKIIIIGSGGFGSSGKAKILNSFDLAGLNLTDEQKETLIVYGIDAVTAKALLTPSIEEQYKEFLKKFKSIELPYKNSDCKTWKKKYFYE